MATVKLTQWEMFAVWNCLCNAVDQGKIHIEHGEALADKLSRATRVSLTLPSQE